MFHTMQFPPFKVHSTRDFSQFRAVLPSLQSNFTLSSPPKAVLVAVSKPAPHNHQSLSVPGFASMDISHKRGLTALALCNVLETRPHVLYRSLSWLNSTPLYGHTTLYLPFHQLMESGVVSTFWFL
jgi:hypothetical protein